MIASDLIETLLSTNPVLLQTRSLYSQLSNKQLKRLIAIAWELNSNATGQLSKRRKLRLQNNPNGVGVDNPDGI